jgi:hypothetical protein
VLHRPNSEAQTREVHEVAGIEERSAAASVAEGDARVGEHLLAVSDLEIDVVGVGHDEMTCPLQQAIGDSLVLQHLGYFPPQVPPHRPQLNSLRLVQRVELVVVQSALQRLLPEAHNLQWFWQPVEFDGYEVQYSSEDGDDVLQLEDAVDFCEDLERGEGEEGEEERGEALFEELGEEHGEEEGEEEVEGEEGGGEEADDDEHVYELLHEEHSFTHDCKANIIRSEIRSMVEWAYRKRDS